MRSLLLMVVSLMAAWPALAHKASDSYLRLDAGHEAPIAGRWDIALVDLERVVGLDRDSDGRITWGELEARASAVMSYALGQLRLSDSAGECNLAPGALLVDEHAGETYASFAFGARCNGAAETLRVDYRLLFDIDPGHRGLLRYTSGTSTFSTVLAPGHASWTVPVGDARTLAGAGSFLREGIHHILIGYDHIAFLLLLLLPAVLRHERGAWQPVPKLGAALWDTAGIVTAFTLAHSVTLTLAALGAISVPGRPVEIAIAASVVVAALHNLFPVKFAPRWAIALTFGLVHGLGFASVLADLSPGGQVIVELAAFNLGVEIGQLAIAIAFVPLVWLARHTRWYRRAFVPLASVAVAMLAGTWLFERAFT